MNVLTRSLWLIAIVPAFLSGASAFPQQSKSSKTLAKINIQAAPALGTAESYAGGKITGTWHFNRFNDDETGTYGHKTVHAAYDSLNNRVCILTDARHVAAADLKDSASLEITNQRVVVNGNLFLGVPSRSGKFRLIGAIQPEWNTGSIYYSDDEGRSWVKSAGGDLSNQEVRWSGILENQEKSVLVLTVKTVSRVGGKTDIYTLLKSGDQGETFQPLKTWEETEAAKVLACKPYNINELYFIRKINNTNQWTILKFNFQSRNFEPVSVYYTPKTPSSLVGTRVRDTTWLFAGANGGGFVSSSAGKAWEARPLRERIATVNPQNPLELVESSANTWFSKDGGKKWDRLPWWEPVFGWDLQNFQWFRNRDDGWTAVLNNDFGAHFTTNFTDSLSWKHLNTDNYHMLIHHGTYEESTDLLITGNQDRGTMIWQKERDGYYKGNTVTKADGLRVCIANQGNSYWYIHYWNTMYHKNFRKGEREKTDSLVIDIPRALRDTTWYTPPMAPSWKPGEDAIFLSGNNRLIKLAYDPYYNSISRMELPYDFRDSTQEVLAGLATTRADASRIYACTKNGRFYFSTDIGKTWKPTDYKGPVPFVKNRPWWGPYGYAIKTAPDNPDIVFWAGEGDSTNAFLKSVDGGKTFTPATMGLPGWSNIRDFAVSPGGEYVFANNGYVYIRDEDRWYDISGGSCPKGAAITGVEYLDKQKTVRYFTYGSGVVDFKLTSIQ